MASWLGRPVVHGDACPPAVMIISAFNEARVIERKLRNALDLDYPKDRIEIWVSSDGSTDDTNAIVRRFARACPRIHLVAYSVNRGKTAALMETVRAVPDSVGVVVFSDANSMYRPDALRKLVRNFADPRVGCVAGELAYKGASGEATYRRYENRIKLAQSRLGAPLTAEGRRDVAGGHDHTAPRGRQRIPRCLRARSRVDRRLSLGCSVTVAAPGTDCEPCREIAPSRS